MKTADLPRQICEIFDPEFAIECCSDREWGNDMSGALYGKQETGATTLPELIRRHAVERPWAPAIVTPLSAPVSYATLAERCAAMGSLLRQEGIGRDGRVGVMLPGDGPLAAALVSTLANAVAVPLDPRLTSAEFADLHSRLRLHALLTDGRTPAPGDRPARKVVLEDEGGGRLVLFVYAARGGPAEAREAAVDGLALILRTSGTTAQPKLVPLTHRNVVARAERLQRWLALTADDRALCVAPLYYAHGLETALFAPLAVGASLACPSLADEGGGAGEILAWLEALEPTYYSAGPTLHRLLLDRVQARGSPLAHRLRLIQSAGAPLAARATSELQASLGVPLLDAYGLSETGQLAANGWAPAARREGTVGRPDPGTLALRAEDGTLLTGTALRAGVTGEILGRGGGVTPGYLDDSGRPQAVLEDGWFRTGDLGVLDEEGFLTIAGRLKEIVNRGGEKIAPAEVDQALLRHPDVSQAAAFAVPHARLGEDLAAAVVPRAGATVTARELRRYLAERLVPFKVPRRIHLVPQLPTGATGKVTRSALAQQLAAPRRQLKVGTALEAEITALWARLLGREAVDPGADFFELGGDSLLAVEMKLSLERLIGHDLPEGLLFDAGTPRQLAIAVATDVLNADLGLLPLRREGRKQPLLFLDGDLAGGGYYMRGLAALLDPDRPLWLLRPFEATKGRLPTIEAMASHYLALLRQEGFRPPYLFGGHCNGGLIALEAARQAEAAGEAVSLVVMIDPISLNARRPLRALVRVLRLLARLGSTKEQKRQDRLGGVLGRLWVLLEWPPWRRRSQPRRRPATAPAVPVDEIEQAAQRRHETRLAAYRKAMAKYLPGPVDARLLCVSAERTKAAGLYAVAPWARFSRSFASTTVPGDHASCLVDGAKALAERLRAELADL
jgi:acyl-CoA synthetase (AMP-forming)/AMP-acid ligase II/thioesterase domain-containing protein